MNKYKNEDPIYLYNNNNILLLNIKHEISSTSFKMLEGKKFILKTWEILNRENLEIVKFSKR